jgi:undecaprenyl-diphosphatase
MLEHLINLDKKLFLAINHFASPGFDPIMRFLSGPVPWVLFVAGLLFMIWPKPWKLNRNGFLIMLAGILLAYLISEQSSVHLFKNVFMRLRPCHEPSLANQVRLAANHCGGQFGFVSTHATNSFTLAMISALLIHRKWFTLTVFAWAIVVSYSRIYLGVHYPGDVLCGATLGCLIGYGMFLGTRQMIKKQKTKNKTQNPKPTLPNNWHISTLAHWHIILLAH